MNPWKHRFLSIAVMLTLVLTVAGCSREARKTKFFQSGQNFAKEGKAAEAVLQYRNALQIDPGYSDARLGLAKLLLQQGDIVGAEAELRRVVDSGTDNIDARRSLAAIYLMANKPDWAQTQAEAALKLDPRDTEAQDLLGGSLLQLQKTADAEKVFRSVLQSSSGNVPALLGVSRCRLMMNDLQGGEKALRDAVTASDYSLPVLLSLSQFLEQQERFDEAEQTLKDTAARYPKDPGALLSLVSFYSRRGNDSAAQAVLAQLRTAANPRTLERTMLADHYAAARQNDKAIGELQFVIQQDGIFDIAAQKLGDLYVDQNRVDDAQALARQLIAKDSKNVTARYLEGRIHLAQGDAAGALQRFQDAAKYLPKSPLLYYYQGMSYLAQKDAHLARGAFNQALEMDPRFGRARVQLARLELAGHEKEAALKDAEMAVRAWPVTQAVMVYVDALVQNGKADTADKLLKTLIAEQMDGTVRGSLRARAAMLKLDEKNFAEARTQLEQARSDMPGSSFPDAAIASSYVLQNDLGRAEDTVQQAMVRFPTSEELSLLRADIHSRKHDFATAEKIYSDALKNNPRSIPARLGLAATVGAQGNWARSAELLEQVGREQRVAQLLGTAGRLREQAAQNDIARNDYEEGLRFIPDDAVILNNISYLLLTTNGNLDVALRYAERAKELNPNSPEISDTLGWVYYHKDRYQFALQYLQTAIQARPNSALYYYHAGKCYAKLQDHKHAEEAFVMALRSSGTFPREDTMNELQRLRQTQ